MSIFNIRVLESLSKIIPLIPGLVKVVLVPGIAKGKVIVVVVEEVAADKEGLHMQLLCGKFL